MIRLLLSLSLSNARRAGRRPVIDKGDPKIKRGEPEDATAQERRPSRSSSLHRLRRIQETTQLPNPSLSLSLSSRRKKKSIIRLLCRYLIVRNVPALGCGDELSDLFASYGHVQECTPMDAEDCEPFTDVYWIKFSHFQSARFAKRKLDESVFLGNRLKVSYAPHFESLSDTKEKLEGRQKEVLGRIKSGRMEGSEPCVSYLHYPDSCSQHCPAHIPSVSDGFEPQTNSNRRNYVRSDQASHSANAFTSHVSSDKEYFASPSMNQTVRLVREKLDRIQSGNEHLAGPAAKKARVDNRRRI